ncbi:alpha/beta hydrolase [Plantactinospora sp. KLBMP9567]|uniref:alpha/beta hydrolase family protein n=1 Tax=Plantactinospora sp. KLBMP9567 TaxID=3085900 RepID=UPI002981C0AD|nr:alpha/beta hydrolase [Plantactinospora sp. KLBMP9567]MDW5330332.1 alpha/beta hydrolase [Plantactinospora sp. KLBMP9567]
MRVNPKVAGLFALLLPIALTASGWVVVAPAPAALPGSAPSRTYAVGVRTLDLGRGTARPLPVTVWYPARDDRPASAAARPTVPRRDAPVAAGRFPIVLFSHGLHSLPELHAPLTIRWASAGFVVAAPAYPHTKRAARRFDRSDIRRQPGDAWRVIQYISRLDQVAGDRFAGHLAVTRIGAVGHSAGGYTTAGLFAPGHSERLRGGIVIGGAGMPGSTFGGPPAPLLFVHGDADRVVPVRRGRDAFRRVPWPKAFLTVRGQGHGEYLIPGRRGFPQTLTATTEFLRWTLYGDARARRDLPAGATAPGTTVFADRLD